MILDGCVFKIILWQDEIMFVYARMTLSKCFTSKLSKLTDSEFETHTYEHNTEGYDRKKYF